MIDIRVNLIPNVADSSLDWDFSARSIVARLRDQMEAAGVTAAMVQTWQEAPAADPLRINPVLRLAAVVPGIYAVGAIDPTRSAPDDIRRAEDAVKSGKVRALAARWDIQDQGFDSPGYRPYLGLASKYDIPVILQRGRARLGMRSSLPILVDDAATANPDVRFVLGQIDHERMTEAAEVVSRNQNVWADLSGLVMGSAAIFASHFEARTPIDRLDDLILEARRAFRLAGKPDRFLFGSGWPMAPIASYRTLVERIIPLEHHQGVFDTNARSLFRLS